MLAVAGSGKTYYICKNLSPEKKNLILGFTHENINNIKRELIEAHGCLPELTNVMTFDSFVYRYLLCPYEPTILQYFGCTEFVKMGITTIDPPSQTLTVKGKKRIPNPKYRKKNQINHYVSQRNQYYCATLSELIMQIKHGRNSLIKKAATTINMFYDQVMIDEFQDFREYDFDLITALGKEIENILLVGDYYQHSVSAANNSGKPFKKKSGNVDYEDFKKNLMSKGFDVDETTLKFSRRCCKNVCKYVNEKLLIDIETCSEKDGNVIWIENDLEEILEDDSIVKLVYNGANNYSFHAVNWSYSKGDTIDNICVILTSKFDNLDQPDFNPNMITSLSTLNKLYVAMTRTKGNLYLTKSTVFQPLKEKYKRVES